MLCQLFYRQGNIFLYFNITANIQRAERLIFLSSFKPVHLLHHGSESVWRIPVLHGWLLPFCNHWWAPTLPLTTGMWLLTLTVNLASQRWGIFMKSLWKVLRSRHIIGNRCWAYYSSWCSFEQVDWTRWSPEVPSTPIYSMWTVMWTIFSLAKPITTVLVKQSFQGVYQKCCPTNSGTFITIQ